MANKNNSQVLMNDQQYYNGGYTKPGTLNKSTIAAMSRENITLNQGQQRRMEPKHLQQPRPRSAVQYRTEQPDLIKDYDQMIGLPNGLHPSYQPDDQLRRSQGTNTKHQREFQIQNNSPQMNGRSHGINPVIRTSVSDRPDQNPAPQNRELVMHKQKSVNGFNLESQTVGDGEKRPRPRSRGVSANSSAIELINMNYNSIQHQLERSLRPPSRMKGEEGSPTTKDVEQSLNSSTGRKTPHDFSQTVPVDDANRNSGRMSQAEIIQNRNMAATRQATVDAPHLRKSRNEESAPGYQHFTQDKVSPIVPIPKKRHEDPPRSSSDRNPEQNAPIPRARIPPHEKNTRMSKDVVDQLRKPRTDADIVIRRNPPPHLSSRKEPMGAESVPVQRPATSMGFVRSTANKQNKDPEQQLNVRQKLELLQRRKSGGANLETNYKDFVANTESSPSRPESRGQRPPSGVKENRRRSYTTSTPAKSEDRLHPKATEKIRQADGRTSRTSSDSSSSKDQSRSSRTNIVAPVSRVPPSGPSGPAFGDRSTHRWKEIEQLSSTSPQEQRRNGRRSSRGDYPFFLDFSKSTPEISNSLDSLNREVSDHLSSNDRPKMNGQSGNTLSAIPKDLKLTMEDLDVQGTPQLSSPVDFNPDGSSNEDLDLEVRTLLGQTENGVDTLDMALYQKLINGSVHKKICSLRDRSFILDKKDNDLKSKRERLQRRMQQTLAKTTAMLNKSVELERSRVHVDLDVMDQSKAEELAVIQSLSSTVRPKTPSGSSGHSTRPQHTTERHIRKHDLRSTQHDVRSIQHDVRSTQHDVRSTQHDVRSTQHDTRVEPPPYSTHQVSGHRREKEEYV